MRLAPAILALLAVAACATEPPPAWQSGDPEVGHRVAQDLCAQCHAVERTGDSPNAAAPPFRTLLSTYRPDWLADDLHNAEAIAFRKMPVFHFGDGHEYDIVAYLMTIQEKPFHVPAS